MYQQILNHAADCYPNEACGLIVCSHYDGKPCYFPCENVALEPENCFEISPEQWLEAEEIGWVKAIVHSHPTGERVLSMADRQMMYQTGVDWWLVANGELQIFPKILPLVGRDFIHFESDCYTLVKDFYFLAGIDLAEFERDDLWWEQGENLYLENIESQGFYRLNDVNEMNFADIVLMQVGADVPNHAGIYLGNQMVLHHSPKRLSKRDVYDGYWLKHTHSVWRYRGELDLSLINQILQGEQC